MCQCLDEHQTEASVVAALCDRLKTHDLLKDIDGKSVVVFSDKSTLPLERFADNPRRKRAAVSVDDQASFADYINAHKINGATALFGRITEVGGSFAGIVDYHVINGIPPAGAGANWGQHSVNLTLGFTPEWIRWTRSDGQPLSQVAFAEMIEDNLPDITDPSAADLLEIVQDLTAKKAVNFKSTARLSNGQVGILYDETITTGKREGQIDLPSQFTISIAPFRGSPAVGITVRLRFRINEGVLQFLYRMNQPHKVLENAFDSARSYIALKTELPVLLGSAKVDAPPSS